MPVVLFMHVMGRTGESTQLQRKVKSWDILVSLGRIPTNRLNLLSLRAGMPRKPVEVQTFYRDRSCIQQKRRKADVAFLRPTENPPAPYRNPSGHLYHLDFRADFLAVLFLGARGGRNQWPREI